LNGRDLAVEVLKRVVKAAIVGALLYAFFYMIPLLALALIESGFLSGLVGGQVPPEVVRFLVEGLRLEELITYTAAVLIFFTVAATLVEGTALAYAFLIGRGLAMAFIWICVTNGGVFSFTLASLSGIPMKVTVNAERFVVALACIGFLDMGRNAIKAVSWACERAGREVER